MTFYKTTKKSKFFAIKTPVDGIMFASKAEAKRYAELKLEQRAGLISELSCQPKFPLNVNDQLICTYIGDFRYFRDGKMTIEDSKSEPTKTPEYRIKKKLLKAIYGIEISEVMNERRRKK